MFFRPWRGTDRVVALEGPLDSLPIQHLGSRFPNKCLCASGIVGDREGLRRKETEPRWGGPRLVSFAPRCEEGQETGKVTDAG